MAKGTGWLSAQLFPQFSNVAVLRCAPVCLRRRELRAKRYITGFAEPAGHLRSQFRQRCPPNLGTSFISGSMRDDGNREIVCVTMPRDGAIIFRDLVVKLGMLRI